MAASIGAPAPEFSSWGSSRASTSGPEAAMRGKFLQAVLALFILATFAAWRTEAQSAARVEAATAEAAAPEAAPAAAIAV